MPKEILPIFNSFVKATCQEANPGYFFPRGKYSTCTCQILLLVSLHCNTKNQSPKLGATNVSLNKEIQKTKMCTYYWQLWQHERKNSHPKMPIFWM